jgi:hypothetical protein
MPRCRLPVGPNADMKNRANPGLSRGLRRYASKNAAVQKNSLKLCLSLVYISIVQCSKAKPITVI